DLADWYLEQIKPRLYGDQAGGDVARAVVARVFEVALQLLHPIMPFITESLWQRMPGRRAGTWLCTTPWPRRDERAADPDAVRGFGRVQELVQAVRSLRGDFGIEPGKSVQVEVPASERDVFGEQATVERLIKGTLLREAPRAGGVAVAAVLTGGTEVKVHIGDGFDLERECARIAADIERLAKLVEGQRAKLENQQFVSRAPREVVERERQKLADWQEQQRVLSERRRRLGCT
ncbi:MAG TPA: class I tRNA ligase family protein, partial [Gemmatimonadales bacterium]|nr:class I tRNA ligase family protein [Gemmatimonadales bacterium]